MRLLSFDSADRHQLPPWHCLLPAALFLQSCCCLWRLPLLLSARPTPSRSVLGLCAKGWRGCLCFSMTARTRVRKWGCWLQHLTFILSSFGELPLRRWSWKLRFHALFWQPSHKYPVSSLTVWRFVYVSVTEIEPVVFVCRFSAPSNYWMTIRFGSKLALVFLLFLPVLETPAKWKFCACPAVVTAYYRFCSCSVPSHGCQVNKVQDVLAAFGTHRALTCIEETDVGPGWWHSITGVTCHATFWATLALLRRYSLELLALLLDFSVKTYLNMNGNL